MDKNIFETRTSTHWLDKDGILRVVIKLGSEVSLADAKESKAVSEKLAGGQKRPVFTDMRGIKSSSREARVFASKKERSEHLSAMALLVDSPISRIIGNFFLGLNKMPVPTKLFTSESEALEWLKEFVSDSKC